MRCCAGGATPILDRPPIPGDSGSYQHDDSRAVRKRGQRLAYCTCASWARSRPHAHGRA
jgi:hypothetical protein